MKIDHLIANEALEHVQRLNSGTEFHVRDLFDESEWSFLTLQGRQQVGLRFYEKLKEQNRLGTEIQELGLFEGATRYRKL